MKTTTEAVNAPDGSSRVAVRGFAASIPASISRFSAIASERAPAIATVIQRRSCPEEPRRRPETRRRRRTAARRRVLDLDQPGKQAARSHRRRLRCGRGRLPCRVREQPSAWVRAGRSTA